MSKKVTAPHEDITYRIIGAAMAVHRRIGPGEKEAIYQRALEEEFTQEGLQFEAEKNIPVYDGDRLLGFYIPDFIVEDKVIVEIKAFAALHQKYLGQVITYLNHTGLAIGLLLNFGERSLRPRRIFPSPQAVEFQHDHRWIFVPDWLKAERGTGTTDQAR
jgi:GxxExxY protein